MLKPSPASCQQLVLAQGAVQDHAAELLLAEGLPGRCLRLGLQLLEGQPMLALWRQTMLLMRL